MDLDLEIDPDFTGRHPFCLNEQQITEAEAAMAEIHARTSELAVMAEVDENLTVNNGRRTGVKRRKPRYRPEARGLMVWLRNATPAGFQEAEATTTAAYQLRPTRPRRSKEVPLETLDHAA